MASSPVSAPSGTNLAVAVVSAARAGGAGIAAERLAAALATHTELDVDLLDPDTLETLPHDVAPPESFSNHRVSDVHFTVEYPGYVRDTLVRRLSRYDVVGIHWSGGLVSLGELEALSARGTRILFWLHDFVHVSGGCHYPGPCTQMATGCLNCPQIDRSRVGADLPAAVLRLKRTILARPNVVVVAPSRYVRDRVVASALVPAQRAHLIRNPYEAPEPATTTAPAAPAGSVRIILVADFLSERRKNVALALEALGRYCAARPPGTVAIDLVGSRDPYLSETIEALKLPATLHGRIAEQARLAALYRDADLILTASVEDNWPNVLVEAGAFGTLAVVGPGHGCEEFVTTYNAGAVASAYTPEAFAQALHSAAEIAPERCSHVARAVQAAHDPAQIAWRFRKLFLDGL